LLVYLQTNITISNRHHVKNLAKRELSRISKNVNYFLVDTNERNSIIITNHEKNLLLILLVIIGMQMNAQKNEYEKSINERVEKLLSELTLEEKASLCSGRDDWSTQSIERLNIPWVWVADGPHGLRRAPATNKPGYGDQIPATCFPTASALAATWDTDLIYKVGQALGVECQALDVNVLLGPGVNIKRSVLGGRNFEFFSEDPILSGEIGASFINGVQSQGVGTSLKHFVANNVETMRMFMNSDLDDRTLHEVYLRPFEIAVKKARPWTVMACYNRVQGRIRYTIGLLDSRYSKRTMGL
jgi:beta-glucosidase